MSLATQHPYDGEWQKQCSKCQTRYFAPKNCFLWLEDTHFYVDKKQKDKLSSVCRRCHKKADKKVAEKKMNKGVAPTKTEGPSLEIFPGIFCDRARKVWEIIDGKETGKIKVDCYVKGQIIHTRVIEEPKS